MHMGLKFDYHKYLKYLLMYNLLYQMFILLTQFTVLRTLQAQVSVWFGLVENLKRNSLW